VLHLQGFERVGNWVVILHCICAVRVTNLAMPTSSHGWRGKSAIQDLAMMATGRGLVDGGNGIETYGICNGSNSMTNVIKVVVMMQNQELIKATSPATLVTKFVRLHFSHAQRARYVYYHINFD